MQQGAIRPVQKITSYVSLERIADERMENSKKAASRNSQGVEGDFRQPLRLTRSRAFQSRQTAELVGEKGDCVNATAAK
jgi:hypothetical protein